MLMTADRAAPAKFSSLEHKTILLNHQRRGDISLMESRDTLGVLEYTQTRDEATPIVLLLTLWNEGAVEKMTDTDQAAQELLRKVTMHHKPDDVSIGVFTSNLPAYRSMKLAARSSHFARFVILMAPDASISPVITSSDQPTPGLPSPKPSKWREMLKARALHRESRVQWFDSTWDPSEGSYMLHTLHDNAEESVVTPQILRASQPGPIVDDKAPILPEVRSWRAPNPAPGRGLTLQSGEMHS
jgi:hypothetical protein